LITETLVQALLFIPAIHRRDSGSTGESNITRDGRPVSPFLMEVDQPVRVSPT
jgi:hypothetical protein